MQPFCEYISMPELCAKTFISSAYKWGIASHPHWHGEIEILYVLTGSAVQQVNDSFFTIKENDFVIIGENCLHSTYSDKGKPCEILVLQIALDGFFFYRDWDFHKKIADACFVSGVKYSKGGGIMKEIFKKNEDSSIYKDIFLRGKIYELLGMILEDFDTFPLSAESQVSQTQKEFIKKVMKFIDDNYKNPITVSYAAQYTHLSISHFVREFKSIMGMPFKYYVNFFRINKSAALLLKGSSVTSAALECGFGNVDSFIRNFKKYNGCTPSVYLNK